MSRSLSRISILLVGLGLLGAGAYFGPRYYRNQKQHESELVHLHKLRGYLDAARTSLGRNDQAGALVQLDLAYQAGVADDGVRFLLPQLLTRLQEPIATLAHDGAVAAVAFSPDGQHAATGSADRTVRTWDARTGAPEQKLSGHEGPIVAVGYSADGARILSHSQDGTARLWDVGKGACLATLRDASGPLWLAQLSPTGSRIVTVTQDARGRAARLWDGRTGAPLATLFGHETAVANARFSGDGRRLVTTSPGAARLWDAERGTLVAALVGHTGTIKDAVFSPDSRRVVTSSADQTARLWDAETGAPLATLEGHTGTVYSASFTLASGKAVMTISADGTARLWDAQTGAPMFQPVGHPRYSQILALSQDGARMVVVSESGAVELWDRILGHMRAQLSGHAGEVVATAFAPSGRRIVTGGSDGTVRLWDGRSGQPLLLFRGHFGKVQALSVSADGTRLISGSADGTARLWRLVAPGYPQPLDGHGSEVASIAWSADGQRLCTTSRDGTARLWERKSSSLLVELPAHSGPLQGARFISWPDGGKPSEAVLTVDPGGEGSGGRVPSRVRISDARTGTLRSELGGELDFGRTLAVSSDGRRVLTASEGGVGALWEPQPTPQPPRRVATLNETAGELAAAVFSPDGSLLATASEGGAVRLWDGRSGAARASGKHDGRVGALAFDEAGQHLLSGGGDRTARIFDTQSGRELFALSGHTGEVRLVRYSPDGTRALTIDAGERAWLWDPRDGRLVAALAKHSSKEYQATVWSPDSSRIVSAGDELRIWDGHSGALLWSIDDTEKSETLTAAAFSPDGTLLATGTLTGPVKLWDVHLETRPPDVVHRDLSQLPAFQRAQSKTGLVPTAADPAPVPASLRPGAYRPYRPAQ
jgi:WD40 repeat protein